MMVGGVSGTTTELTTTQLVSTDSSYPVPQCLKDRMKEFPVPLGYGGGGLLNNGT